MKLFFYIYVFSLIQISCKADQKKMNTIICDESGCSGTYIGSEFVNGEDIAHQFSNKMSAAVGDQLKYFYNQKKYKKVDFSKIKMKTEGMGSGEVVYALSIPFISVGSKCEAYTSFDHVGGWNHKPDLKRRKQELKNVTLKGEMLQISSLKRTPEGLQEYWIQWKNKTTQFDCAVIRVNEE